MHMRAIAASVVVLTLGAVTGCGAGRVPSAARSSQTRATTAGVSAPAGTASCREARPVRPSEAGAAPPAVGSAAFAGQGRLAFVTAGRLYVLDGTAAGRPARLYPVAAPAGAVAPAFSPDGRWLAFLVSPPSPYPVVASPAGTLWLARADGQDARPVLADAGPFAWSPVSDVLAATVYPPVGPALLCELSPGARPRLVPGAGGPAVWSPDGRELAFTGMAGRPPGRFSGLLETVPASGGAPTIWYRSAGNALMLAGWWPDGRGLLAWLDEQNSASLAADGLPVVSVPLSGRKVATLGLTLVYSPFVATSPGTGLAALAAGGDREEWDGKTVLLCRLAGGCTGLPGGQPGPTDTDPALSPDGTSLAFIHGAGSGMPDNFSQASIGQWYATRSLWILVLPGGRPHQLTAAGTSAADPSWSASSQLLLYVRDDGLWLINPHGGGPARIVTILFRGAWPSYYYYIDWRDQFAWSSPRRR
jgi:hypothetical protein